VQLEHDPQPDRDDRDQADRHPEQHPPHTSNRRDTAGRGVSLEQGKRTPRQSLKSEWTQEDSRQCRR
jgi:hypothetical protein